MALNVPRMAKRAFAADDHDDNTAGPIMPQSAEPPQTANLQQQITEWMAIMEKERNDMKKLTEDHETRMRDHERRLQNLVTLAEQQKHHRMDGVGPSTPKMHDAEESPDTARMRILEKELADLGAKKAAVEDFVRTTATGTEGDAWQEEGKPDPWNKGRGSADGAPAAAAKQPKPQVSEPSAGPSEIPKAHGPSDERAAARENAELTSRIARAWSS